MEIVPHVVGRPNHQAHSKNIVTIAPKQPHPAVSPSLSLKVIFI